MGLIELITHPYAVDLLRSRIDRAKVTGKELVERPHWFRNTETGQLYFDLYACLGWPSEVTDSSDGQPGYAAIVGIVRPDTEFDTDPINAKFQLLDEAKSMDVPILLKRCLELREKYGFGIHKDLFRVWIGDPDRFLTTLALTNERLLEDGNDRNAILLSPPIDFYVQKIFDNYVRDLRSVLLKETRRFFFGYNDILQNKLRSGFLKDDPCIVAMGGLVHSLLCQCTWMNSQSETIFTIED
uniref:Terminase n=1 Tax=viral metagenome TaxID=1070528 RepID=A0A6M3JY30_9ZZZZ